MREVGVLEAKTHFSSLVDAVERGDGDVVITRHGRPAVRLTRLEGRRGRADGVELLSRAKAIREAAASRGGPIDTDAWLRKDRDGR